MPRLNLENRTQIWGLLIAWLRQSAVARRYVLAAHRYGIDIRASWISCDRAMTRRQYTSIR